MIVRELVTRLGFQVDRQGIQLFNQQILGIKTRFALAATAVGGFVYQTLQSIRDVGNLISDTENLSKRTGIAFNNLVALREAAKTFRIEPAQFEGALRSFSKMANEAKFGLGSLFQLSRDLKVSIRDANGELKETDVLFFEMVDQIAKIGDERVRIEAFAKVFGEDVAEKFNEFFKNGSAGAKELAESFQHVGQTLQGQKPIFDEYEKNLSTLETTFGTFKTELVTAIAPAVNDVLTGWNFLLQQGREEFGGGILGTLKATGDVLSQSLLSLFNMDRVSIERGQIEADQEEFRRRVEQFKAQRNITEQNISVDSTINIEVPPGTTEEQQQVIKDSVEQAYRDQSEEMIRQLLNNNPQVE